MTATRTLAGSHLPATNGSVQEHGGQLGRYRLEPPTPDEAARWDDLITAYDSTQLFHQTAWLHYLAESRGVEIRRWAIRNDDRTVGYFCGGFFKMGPFRILGSPLKSWGTNYMGPLIDDQVSQESLISALDSLAHAERLAMLEIEHPILSPAVLQAAGFEPVSDWTYLVSLAPDNPDAMWGRLESRSGRKRTTTPTLSMFLS